MHGPPHHSRSHWGTVGVFWMAVLAALLLFGVGSGTLHLAPVVAGIPAFGVVVVAFIVVAHTGKRRDQARATANTGTGTEVRTQRGERARCVTL